MLSLEHSLQALTLQHPVNEELHQPGLQIPAFQVQTPLGGVRTSPTVYLGMILEEKHLVPSLHGLLHLTPPSCVPTWDRSSEGSVLNKMMGILIWFHFT